MVAKVVKTAVVKTTVSKKKKSAPTETSLSIQEQTAAFLKAGGEIQVINSGVSGQHNLAGPKHISLGNKQREA
tara:strand:- start:176 stop:394 length:219 start_codon:yes stop_codon:yes gene_type:complete